MAIKISAGLKHDFSQIRAAQQKLRTFIEKKGSSFTGPQRDEIVMIYDVILRHLIAFQRIVDDNEK